MQSPEIVEFLKSSGVETLRTGATPDQVYVRTIVDLRWANSDLPKEVLTMFGDEHVRSAFKSFMTEDSDGDFIALAEERFRLQNAEAYLLLFQRMFLKNAHKAASTDTIVLLKRIDALERKLDAQGVAPAPPSFSIRNLAPRNRNFTGRDDLMKNLRETLEAGSAAALTALYGLGGIGKTQVALEYAYRFANEYDLIWWVKAETEAARTADIESLARELKLPEIGQTADVVREAVKRYLRTPGQRWLMILDNAPNPEDLKPFLMSGGHVLITSRYQAWKGTAKPLEVEKMHPDEAQDFLLRRTGKQDADAAAAIAKELDYLPLALEQAGAYIEKTGKQLAEYLTLYKEKHTRLFESGVAKPSQGYPDTVLTTWTMSFEAAAKQCAAAGDLLNLCAYFAPDDIPLDVIAAGVEHLQEALAACVKDESRLDEAIAALKDYSLITRNEKGLSVHRLVQEVMRDRLPEDVQKLWIAAATEIVNKAFPYIELNEWPLCDLLLPHGLAAALHGESAGVAQEAVGRLLNQCGYYLRERARYEEAKDCFERALKIDEAALGKDHPDVAIDVNNLGRVLQDQGDLARAKQCYERALKIDEAVYGKDHPNVATLENNLGDVLQAQGDLKGAKQCFERALKISEATLGRDHPTVAISVNNLGDVLRKQGDLEGAKQCFERAIEIRERHTDFGPNHPDTATNVNNLGNVLWDQGDLAGAKQCYERALKIWEKHLGEHHPQVAIGVNNLGLVLRDQGDLKGAKQCFERALKIGETTLGKDHPEVAVWVNNLGTVLKDQGDLEEAKRCFDRALRIDEAVYGKDHPNVARDVNNLGGVLRVEGDLKGAKQCYERALKICMQFLGAEHPYSKMSQENLDVVLEQIEQGGR